MTEPIAPAAAAPSGSRLSSGTERPEKLKDAASQFEALLIGQLLKSAREESSGWLGSGEDGQADSSMLDIAQEQLALALAKQGGLGVARLVVQGLERKP